MRMGRVTFRLMLLLDGSSLYMYTISARPPPKIKTPTAKPVKRMGATEFPEFPDRNVIRLSALYAIR